jgi:hypothetical protein
MRDERPADAGGVDVRALALTLHPEWPTFIAWRGGLDGDLHPAGKRVENRGWPCPAWLIGCDLAIHAGLRVGGLATVEQIRRWSANGTRALSVTGILDALRGAVHMGEAAGVITSGRFTVGALLDLMTPGHVVALVRVTGCDLDQRTPWDVPGQYHWRFEDVRALTEPVPCRGAQGLWRLSAEADTAVRGQLRSAVPRGGPDGLP